MKKIATSLAMMAMICTSASAQSTFWSSEKPEKTITYGAHVGMNVAKQHISNSPEQPGACIGFNVGGDLNIALNKSFLVKTGLEFTQKGWKESEDSYSSSEKPMYLQIPIMASYRMNFSDDFKLDVDFGPYLAVGVAGKAVEKYKKEKEDYKLFDGDNGYKRFDAGLRLGATANFKQFNLGLHYELGLTKVYEEGPTNRNLSISLGMTF